MAPTEARIWSDLAAAYYVRAQRLDEPLDLLRALEATDRAVELSPENPVPLFNRALILERLFLRGEAREAWNRYLLLEKDPGWRAEALRHVNALEAPGGEPWEQSLPAVTWTALAGNRHILPDLVRRHRLQAREYAERSLARWAEAVLQGDPSKADRQLQLARLLGTTLAELGGDRLIQDAVRAIDRALESRDRSSLEALVEGHQAYGSGYELYKALSVEEAVVSLTRAREALKRGGSPFADYAAFYLACCDHYRRRYAQASLAVENVGTSVRGLPYPSLLGYVGWMEGLARLTRGDPLGAADSYRRSIELFDQAGETENAVRARSQLAVSLDLFGMTGASWQEAYQALRSTPEMSDPKDRAQIFMAGSDLALRQGHLGAALAFENEMVRESYRTLDLAVISDALFWRGLILDQMGHHAAARNELDQAKQAIARHPDPALRRRIATDIDLIEGTILAGSDPAKAVPLLTEALTAYETTEHRFFSVLGYRARAQAYRRLGRMPEAEKDMQSALDFYDRLGEGISQQDVLLAYLRQTGELFDEMTAFQTTIRRRPDRAFEYADRARTRVLPTISARISAEPDQLRRIFDALPSPHSSVEIQKHLPRSTTLVQFSVLPERLLIWVVDDKRFELIERPLPASQLGKSVEQLMTSRYRPEAWDRASVELYDALVRPWISSLPAGERVVFVPDKSLNGVPFSCLRDRHTGRSLVEDRETWVAPSATLFVEMEDRLRELALRPPRTPALLVGNPDFDQSRFQGLSSLPGAAQEVNEISRLYPGSVVRTGAQATRGEVLSHLSDAWLIHFAGHSILNPRDPLLNSLVLARSPVAGDSGALTAQDFFGLDLRKTRLAFLSACFSGRSGPEDAGVSILARSLFAAGVPTVVASLWEVEDRPGAALAEEFHRHLKAGDPPAAALRKAQLAMLRSGNRALQAPWSWGAFQVIGAGGS